MLLRTGEKIHVMTRRNLEGDVRRHFVGEVKELGEMAVRVEGYSFVYNPETDRFEKRPELRTRIISLADAANVINVLPADVAISQLRYALSPERRLTLSDGEALHLDINEFGPRY